MSIRLKSNLDIFVLQQNILNVIADNAVSEVVFYSSFPKVLQDFVISLCDGSRYDFVITILNGTVFDHFLCRREIKNCDIAFFIRSTELPFSLEWELTAKKCKTVYYVYNL
jgi:hypothetical protein